MRFKRRRFPVEIILVCVRWYCKYGISYRDLAEMMQERGIEVDPSTIMRWVHRYAPELENRVRWYPGYRATSWRVDETYVKFGGEWKYLFRAVDKHGRLIDFMLMDRRNTRAARRFLGKALTTMRHCRRPPSRLTNSAPIQSAQPAATRRQAAGRFEASHLQVPQQHHRGRPWSSQTGHRPHPRLSGNEDGIRYDQGL